jgi:hypothetical protein
MKVEIDNTHKQKVETIEIYRQGARYTITDTEEGLRVHKFARKQPAKDRLHVTPEVSNVITIK